MGAAKAPCLHMRAKVVNEKVQVKTLLDTRLDGNDVAAGVVVEIDPELAPVWVAKGIATKDLSTAVSESGTENQVPPNDSPSEPSGAQESGETVQ